MAKQSECGRTPWHYDAHHFPLATSDIITAWIPAQPIPIEMGPLSFAKPLDAYKLVQNIKFNKFNTSYDRKVSDIFKSNLVSIENSSFDMGEISFHHNLCFHTANKNNTNQTRMVLANTYFVNGARVVKKPTMVSGDWQKFLPGISPGQIAASKLNPVCWSEKEIKLHHD